MIVCKTLDGPHYASEGYLTGAMHIPSQITLEEVFEHDAAIDASQGWPLTLVQEGEWPAVRSAVTKPECFAILGDLIDEPDELAETS